MYHTNRNDVIETSEDIQDVLGVHVGEENGQKVATLKVLLDPRKDFLAVKDFFVHLTNGINHRMIGPLTAVNAPSELPTVPVPVEEPPVVEEAPLETAMPSAETGATHAEPGEPAALAAETPSTAEVSTDVPTGDETVKTSAVTPPFEREKGQ
jgi:hypothetical protein